MTNNSNRKAIEFMVQGALPPHSTNVLWMDTSVPTLPVLKIFENGTWTTVHTGDSKAIELLSQTVLAQQNEITELTEDISNKIALDATVAKQQTLTQGIQNISDAIANIDISNLAKQGSDATATNTAILEEVKKVTAVDADILSGKMRIASAITSKGVPATHTDSLNAMATKVRAISQQINTRTSDFEQMIAPYPYMWNVYIVATELMQNELPSYVPSYMAEYRLRYGANSFFVGEYYLGYTTLELTGADGYLTCDGDFYTISNGVVTHTSPDGAIETYEAESIIHTWHDVADNMANRWIAFFYLADAYSFTNITSSICPRRVALCGTCNSFTISGECRLTNVWVIGTLNSLSCGTGEEAWNPEQVIKNYKVHAGDAIYTKTHLISLVMPDLETLTGRIFGIQNNIHDNPCADYIYLPKLTTLSENSLVLLTGPSKDKYGTTISNGPVFINLPKLTTCNVPICTSTIQSGFIYDKMIEISLESLEELNITSNGGGRLGALNQGIISAWGGNQWNTFKRIYIPSLKRIVSGSILSKDTNQRDNRFKNLIDIEVGAMETNIDLSTWVATDVLADPDKKAQLIDNIKNHILAKVSDATESTQLVFTVSTTMYDAIASEQIEWQGETMSLADAFLTKNWLLSGA